MRGKKKEKEIDDYERQASKKKIDQKLTRLGENTKTFNDISQKS